MNGEAELAVGAGEREVDAGRLGMPDDVGEGLLGGAVDQGFDLGIGVGVEGGASTVPANRWATPLMSHSCRTASSSFSRCHSGGCRRRETPRT